MAGGYTIPSIDGAVMTVNSSTELLSSGTTFTGQWVEATGYASVVVAAQTDQNGELYVQFSSDATNIESSLVRYYRTDTIEVPHRYTITRRYVRVVFTNSSTGNQTYFRLQSMLCYQTDLNAPLDSTLSPDYDSQSVRPTDFKTEVAISRRQGLISWHKWGYNADVDTGTETVWSYGGTFSPLTNFNYLSIVSSSTNDTSAGTGARQITIYGIDAFRKSQTEVITMNGTTPVVTTTKWLGINRVAVTLSGSGLTNAGDITITATTAGSVQAHVPAGTSITQQAFFFTQADHKGVADWLFLNVNKITGGASPVVTIKGFIRNFSTNTVSEIFSHTIDTTVDDYLELKPPTPFLIPEQSLIYFTATTNADNTIVNLRFAMIEIRDVDA